MALVAFYFFPKVQKMWFISGALGALNGDGVDQVNDLIVLLLPCGVGWGL